MKRRIFLAIAASWTIAMSAASASAQEIVVGGKGFTEQLIMAEMTAQLLKANGFEPDQRVGMGTAVVRQALESGQVHLYWEYTGTALSVFHKFKEPLGAQEGYEKIKELDAEKGIVWLNPTDVNNSYAIGMLKARADELGISTLSDLAESYNSDKNLVIGVNAEFAQRQDGLPGVEQKYAFEVPPDDLKKMDFGLSYQALRDKQVDAAMVTSTDGRVLAFNVKVLEDDKGFFPTYLLTPVVRKEVLDANPGLSDILNKLSTKLDSATILKLNAAVDVDKKSVGEVASEFLKSQSLI